MANDLDTAEDRARWAWFWAPALTILAFGAILAVAIGVQHPELTAVEAVAFGFGVVVAVVAGLFAVLIGLAAALLAAAVGLIAAALGLAVAVGASGFALALVLSPLLALIFLWLFLRERQLRTQRDEAPAAA